MGEIRVLDKRVAELIAAGEVIDRPASVVKELLENSIDAGAKRITVEIKNGGIDLIRVTDDGKGIASEDVETAFLRHATSKVHNEEDLNEILTLGFRGEALASVCAVAKVSMLTRQRENDIGCHIEIDGGEIVEKIEAGCPVGTTIMVKNIFYNTPARMKFLKKDVSEANAVASIVEKIAVSNPHISFKFIRDGRIDIQTVGDGKLFSAIHCVFGKFFADILLPVNYEKNGVKVTGFISKANDGRAKRSMQFFFLNGRTVKNITMTVALEEAYKGSIMVGKFPAAVLLVEVSPMVVDVNVHPTKTEIRFSDEKIIYDAVYFACKNALLEDSGEAEFTFREEKISKNLAESTRFIDVNISGEQTTLEDNKPLEIKKEIPKEELIEVDNPFFVKKSSIENLMFDSSRERPTFSNGQILHTISEINEMRRQESERLSALSSEEREEELVKEEEEEQREKAQRILMSGKTDNRFNNAKIIGELFKTYIMLECDDAIYLVDKHAAHERLIFDSMKNSESKIEKQYLLEPVVARLSRDEYDAAIMHKEMIENIGFDIDDFGKGAIVIRAVPSYVSMDNAVVVLTDIASNLTLSKKDISPHLIEDIYHRIACRAAIKARDNNNEYELAFLIDCLRKQTDVKHCPHGRPITVRISKNEIERKFGRIQ